eukprot:2694048-Pleurochrysis_carterae.AAC.1
MLEPYPLIDASAFESCWSGSSDRSAVFHASLRASPSPDEVELALTHAGLVCIAAGAVGEVHKSYYAAQLRPHARGGGEWLMLELIVQLHARAVQASFRASAEGWLSQTIEHFVPVLARAIDAELHRADATR